MNRVTIFISSLLNVAFVPCNTYLFTNHSSCSACIMCYLCPPLYLHYYIGDDLQHALWGFIWVLFAALNYSVLIYHFDLLPWHMHIVLSSQMLVVLSCSHFSAYMWFKIRKQNSFKPYVSFPGPIPYHDVIELCTCNKHNILFTTALYQASPVPSFYNSSLMYRDCFRT